jgi:hypothetical protein
MSQPRTDQPPEKSFHPFEEMVKIAVLRCAQVVVLCAVEMGHFVLPFVATFWLVVIVNFYVEKSRGGATGHRDLMDFGRIVYWTREKCIDSFYMDSVTRGSAGRSVVIKHRDAIEFRAIDFLSC